jgi:branched-chain amino acid transport system permease protein
MNFFFEVLIGGLLSGVMYALVALGFVLIYKASGVFNFAQGAMVYLAALSVVGCMEWGAPLWLAIILAFVIMTLFGIATEKFVLRKLVNQPPITLFMATIGLAFFIEGWRRWFSAASRGRWSWASSMSRSRTSSTTGTW